MNINQTFIRKRILNNIFLIFGLFSVLGNSVIGQGVNHWETVFYSNTTYRYFTSAEGTPATDWRSPGFNDLAWRSGKGSIGYGDGDDNTVIEKCIALFMRTEFSITDTSVILDGILHVDYDDAFVAYLNGVEIARSQGLSGDYPSADQLSTVNHEASMYSGGLPEAFFPDRVKLKSLLKIGKNVLAVQIHNSSPGSSDMTSNIFFSVGLTTQEQQYSLTPPWFYLPFVFRGSTLPLLIINTDGKPIPDEPKIDASMKIIYNGTGVTNHPDDSANVYNGKIGIEIRGASSSGYPQKPYSLETRDSLGENNNVSILGMPKENDWVLLSHYNEKTFMRNLISYHLFAKMGHYATRARLVDVILNGRYDGIYLLGEKVKRDQNRIDIAPMMPDASTGAALTGGYIFKVDYAYSNDSWLSAYSPVDHPDYDTRFVYYYPKWYLISDAQKTYLQGHVNAFQKAMHQPDFADTYQNYIDVLSFIDYFIVSEVSRNVDGYKKSRYFFKDRDDRGGLIHAGPVWDFDWAWKNIYDCSLLRNTTGAGWAYRVNDCRRTYTPGWYVRLLEDPAFADMVNCRYFYLRENILSMDNINAFIDSVYQVVDAAQENHYQRWKILGIKTGAPEIEPPAQTYDEEVARLRNWIQIRLNWLDANMPGTNQNCGLINAKKDAGQIIFRIYPNPASSDLYIESDEPIDRIQLYDMTGKVVISVNTGNSYSWHLNLGGFRSGLYFVKTFMNDNQWIVRKIMIE